MKYLKVNDYHLNPNERANEREQKKLSELCNSAENFLDL